MIYIKSNEHNIINNYNDKVKMILRSRLEANIKYVVPVSRRGQRRDLAVERKIKLHCSWHQPHNDRQITCSSVATGTMSTAWKRRQHSGICCRSSFKDHAAASRQLKVNAGDYERLISVPVTTFVCLYAVTNVFGVSTWNQTVVTQICWSAGGNTLYIT